MSEQAKPTVKTKVALGAISGAELVHAEGGSSFAIQKSQRDETAENGWRNFQLYVNASELVALNVVTQKLLEQHIKGQLD